MPKILTEKSSTLSYIKEDKGEGKHYLGKLAGIGAEFNKPTRNGRRYPLELWRNVEKSEDFKEGMATHTIFGECDHPLERIETAIKEIAIVLTKFEIREAEGNVYTEFHILDTPNGRILKELLDYGSQIGVSTRGLGDEIVKDGETIIDPETFVFFAWDAVVMPAVKSARPSVVEGKKATLIESLNNEINSANSIDELMSIKRVINKVPELDSISESIDNKLNTMKDGDNISPKLESELGKISEENVRLTEQIDTLNNKVSANNIRIKKLSNGIKKFNESNRQLRKSLSEKLKYTATLEDTLYDTVKDNDNKDKQIGKLESNSKSNQNKVAELESQIRTLKRKQSAMVEESKAKLNRLQKELENFQSANMTLKNELARTKSLLESTNDDIVTLQNSNDELVNANKKLLEQKTQTQQKILNEKHKSSVITADYESALSETLEKYLETKCKSNGIKVETVKRLLPEKYTTKDIDSVVEELADRQRRYDALPFANLSTNIVLNESFSNLTDADKQTMAFLNGIK